MPYPPTGTGQRKLRFPAAFSVIALILGKAFAISIPLVALLATVAWRGYGVEKDLVREQLFTEADSTLAAQARSMEVQIMAVVRDVVFLAGTTSLRRMLDSGMPEERDLLAQLFLNAVARKGYDQVRFIDTTGRERVRIQLRLASPVVVPEEELQDKSGRYYVTAALALERNEVFVSPMDLNVEQGQLEQPLKPTYRVCTPVFDSQKRKRGILVVNVRARGMLEGLESGSSPGARRIMLLDDAGYWLKAPDSADEWGFMYPDRRDLTFVRRHPAVWDALGKDDSSRVEAEEGLYVSRRVRVASSGSEAGPGVWVFQGQAPGRSGFAELRLVALVPRDHFESRLGSLTAGSLRSFLGAAVVILAFAMVLAVVLERRKADKRQLQSLNARLEGVLDSATEVSIIATDPQGTITTFNRGAERLLGYEAEELLERKTPAAFHLVSEVMRRGRELSAELGRPVEGFEVFVAKARDLGHETREWTYVRKDGEPRMVSLTVTAIRDHQGALAGFLGVAQDITFEREAKARLQFQNLLMNAFSEASPDAIVVVDQMDHALYHNVRFLEMWGLAAGELDNRPCSEILAKVLPQVRDSQAFEQRIVELERNPAERDFSEIELVDGRTMERTSVGLFGEGGAYLARAWFYRDVTARVRAAEALRESRARLAAVLDNAVDGIVTIDTSGRILSVNPAVESIFGWTRQEMEGGPVNRLMMEPYASRHDGYLKRYLEGRAPRVIGQAGREVPGRRKDGSMVPLELAVSEVRVGDTRLFTGILRDITERKQAQERIMSANAELEARQMRLDEDLVAAGEIQKSLLPQQLPEVGGGLEIDWLFEPSQRIGGDIFDIFALDGDTLAVYILDVSGHGVPSALVTVSVSQSLQPGSGIVSQGIPGGPARIVPPAQVMESLNREFPIERFDKFFSMVYLVLDHRTGRVDYCNAGHPPPLVVRSDGSLERLEAGGMLVGMGEVAVYEGGTVTLGQGDVLLLYTDGVTEYADVGEEFFGEERLEQVARHMAGRHPDESLEMLWAALMRFGRGAEPGDDVSMVCIRRSGR